MRQIDGASSATRMDSLQDFFLPEGTLGDFLVEGNFLVTEEDFIVEQIALGESRYLVVGVTLEFTEVISVLRFKLPVVFLLFEFLVKTKSS